MEQTTIDTKDTITDKKHPDISLIQEDDIYCLNPLVRMRNEHTHVEIYKKEAKEYPKVHHICGVIFAMCDGKNTVGDIARSLIPLLKKKDQLNSENLESEALSRVKQIISYFSEDPQVDLREQGRRFMTPSAAWLVPKDVLPGFGRLRAPSYDVKDFLPENAYKPGKFDRSIKRRVPVFLHWFFTSQCTANCRYCLLNRRNIPKDKMISRERMLEIVKESKDIGVIQIIPEGGDFLLYPYLFDFLDLYEEYLMMQFNFSTKSYLSKDMVQKLGKYSVIHQVQFSVDSTIPEIAEYLTGVPSYCKRMFKSVENALEAGIQVVIVKAVLTPYNILTVPRLFRDFYKLGVRFFRFAPYERSAHHHNDGFLNHEETYTWFDDQLKKLEKEFPDVIVDWQDEPPEKELSEPEILEKWKEDKTRMGCTSGKVGMVICADGKVMPCDVLPETEEYFLGDLKYQSVQEVWDGEKLNNRHVFYKKEMFSGTPCGDCDDFDNCIGHTGYCFQRSYVRTGKIYMTPCECPKYNGPFVRLH